MTSTDNWHQPGSHFPPTARPRFQYATPQPQYTTPEIPIPSRNDKQLTRDSLITILNYFATLIPSHFNGRPIRLVVHGGACMLLHPGLSALAVEQHHLATHSSPKSPHNALPRRTSTRDIDYIHRSFVTELEESGVTDAADRIKRCIKLTAEYFHLGADWMNSDADISLPMAVDVNGKQYDPIYQGAIQLNNVHLHTVYESNDKMLTLISVPPVWSIALKLARYIRYDPGDICLLLRNGTNLNNCFWTNSGLESWLHQDAWPMGYHLYTETKKKELQVRIRHAIDMVMSWDSATAQGPVIPESSTAHTTNTTNTNIAATILGGDESSSSAAAAAAAAEWTRHRWSSSDHQPPPLPSHHRSSRSESWSSASQDPQQQQQQQQVAVRRSSNYTIDSSPEFLEDRWLTTPPPPPPSSRSRTHAHTHTHVHHAHTYPHPHPHPHSHHRHHHHRRPSLGLGGGQIPWHDAQYEAEIQKTDRFVESVVQESMRASTLLFPGTTAAAGAMDMHESYTNSNRFTSAAAAAAMARKARAKRRAKNRNVDRRAKWLLLPFNFVDSDSDSDLESDDDEDGEEAGDDAGDEEDGQYGRSRRQVTTPARLLRDDEPFIPRPEAMRIYAAPTPTPTSTPTPSFQYNTSPPPPPPPSRRNVPTTTPYQFNLHQRAHSTSPYPVTTIQPDAWIQTQTQEPPVAFQSQSQSQSQLQHSLRRSQSSLYLTEQRGPPPPPLLSSSSRQHPLLSERPSTPIAPVKERHRPPPLELSPIGPLLVF